MSTDGTPLVEARELGLRYVSADQATFEALRDEATRRLIADSGETPSRVLMLTTFDLNEYVYEALRAGASGFLLKDVPPEELAAGIRVVFARRRAPGAVDHAPADP